MLRLQDTSLNKQTAVAAMHTVNHRIPGKNRLNEVITLIIGSRNPDSLGLIDRWRKHSSSHPFPCRHLWRTPGSGTLPGLLSLRLDYGHRAAQRCRSHLVSSPCASTLFDSSGPHAHLPGAPSAIHGEPALTGGASAGKSRLTETHALASGAVWSRG